MCQEINHTPAKQKGRLAMPLENQSILTVIIVGKNQLQVHLVIKRRRDITVQLSVTQKTGKKTGNQRNIVIGRVELLHTRLIEDGVRKIQKDWLTLRQEDMLGKKMQKALILLKNGMSLKINLIISVRFVEVIKNLLKTISFRYQKMEQTILITFNLFAETVTVENGKQFNIYENLELIK